MEAHSPQVQEAGVGDRYRGQRWVMEYQKVSEESNCSFGLVAWLSMREDTA